MFAVMGVTVSAAGAAARPHTIGQPIVDIDSSGNLSVQWKVAGLGNFTSAAFLTADREAVYGCDNPGVGGDGIQIPPGQPVIFTDVVGPTTTIPPSNGQITFTVGIPAPPAPSPTGFLPGEQLERRAGQHHLCQRGAAHPARGCGRPDGAIGHLQREVHRAVEEASAEGRGPRAGSAPCFAPREFRRK